MRRRPQVRPRLESLEDRRTPSLVVGPTVTHSRMTLRPSAGPSVVQVQDFVSRRSRDVVLVRAARAGTVNLALTESGVGKAHAVMTVQSAKGQILYQSRPDDGPASDSFSVARGEAFYVVVSPVGKGSVRYSLSYQLS